MTTQNDSDLLAQVVTGTMPGGDEQNDRIETVPLKPFWRFEMSILIIAVAAIAVGVLALYVVTELDYAGFDWAALARRAGILATIIAAAGAGYLVRTW